MAFYSSGQAKTLYVDPKSFVDGRRAVFELDGHHLAYLPNMSLLNIGIFGADAAYNQLIGAHSIIESIHLYDGKTKLTEVKKYGLYRGFVAHNQRNSAAMSVSAQKSLNSLGYQRDNTDGKLKYQAGTKGVDNNSGATARANSQGAVVHLNEVLPMLNAVSHLPSDLFPNLRLEVVFDTSLARQIKDDITSAIAGQLIPLLKVDVLDDKELVMKMNKALGKGIQWLEVEHDQVLYPQSADFGNNGAADQGVEEVKNFKLDGFRGKRVERLLQIKENADPTNFLNGNAVQGFGRNSSVAVFNEKLQVRLNGRNILPDVGMTGSAERLAYFIDTYGDSFAYPGSNNVDILSSEVAEGTTNDAIASQLSYNGIYIGEHVKDLQIQHSRTGLEDTGGATGFRPSIANLNVHYFAEVQKALVLQKNGYMVSYL